MLLTKTVFKDCNSYLIERGYQVTSFRAGANRMNLLMNTSNRNMVRLQIIDDEVVFNKTHTITCLRDIIEIITNNFEPEHKKYPALDDLIEKINANIKPEDVERWDALVNEIDLALIEAKFKK